MKYKLAIKINAYKKMFFLVAILCFLLERPVSFLFDLGYWSTIYVLGLILTAFLLLVIALERIFAIKINANERLQERWKPTRKWMLVILCGMFLYGAITGFSRSAVHYVKTIYYEPRSIGESAEMDKRHGFSWSLENNWDNYQYSYLENWQVFDVAAEEVIDYEDYVRRFQEGSFYSEIYHSDTMQLDILKDGAVWYSTILKEPVEAFMCSHKRNYLLLNYGSLVSEMIDIKNKKLLLCPNEDGLFGPWTKSDGTLYYEKEMQVYPQWSPSEAQVILGYSPYGSDSREYSIVGWNLETGDFTFNNIKEDRLSLETRLYFDYNGSCFAGMNSIAYYGKWINDNRILYPRGSTGRYASLGDGWSGGPESGVETYDRELNIAGRTYRSEHFSSLSLDNVHGYVFRKGNIEKFRYRWF